jgi:hypothetical protein
MAYNFRRGDCDQAFLAIPGLAGSAYLVPPVLLARRIVFGAVSAVEEDVAVARAALTVSGNKSG